ncbi:unnamed protein product [Mesocestoides corti]|uniref:Transcription factor 25 n=1 Tax=Mesocestoides corti TaxID=53468 RepID=A0A158QT36_MESCO|nr:unnamed protein product [Mesocestoides corti]
MSSRALRKLANADAVTNSVDEDDTQQWVPRTKQSIFSLVDLEEASEEIASPLNDAPTHEEHQRHKSHATKRNKKKRRKGATNKPNSDVDEDLLLEQAQHAPPIELEAPSSATNTDDCLTVNKKFLDYMAELQRKFGTDATGGMPKGRRGAFGPLVRPKANWPPFIKCGLAMKRCDEDPIGNLFAFTHSKDYSRQQRAFYALQDALDPNTLSMVLSKAPYHVDTLLQLSDYLMHQDQSEVGADLLERALYAFQSAFHLSFNFSTRSCRLDYRVQENRSLFVALFRYIFYVASRSSYRAALEYSKILLLLEPDKDPMAITLALDFFAIVTEEYEFLISFFETWNPKRRLNLLPNFAFSMPLVRWLQRNRPRKRRPSSDLLEPEEIDAMLQDALLMFPGFLPRLMKHVKVGGTDNLAKSVLFGKEVSTSESEGLGRLLDVYVSQMRYHWQEADVLAWLERNVEAVLQLVEPVVLSDAESSPTHNPVPDHRLEEYSKRRKSLYTHPPRCVLRYIFLRDLPDVPPLVPPTFANQQIYPLDPFPPADSINAYDLEAERRDRQNAAGGPVGFLNALFASLWPTVPDRANDVADFNAILAEFGFQVVVDEEDGEGAQEDENGDIFEQID